jgi:hypothetical protein
MLDTLSLVQNVPNLNSLGNIPPEYQHHKRLVTPDTDFSLPTGYFKWYNLHRPELTIAPELGQESRAFLHSEVAGGRLKLDNELGFVILHRCDEVVFLSALTWRNFNELWRTIYLKNLKTAGDFQLMEMERHAHTYCVWELAVVWHERTLWADYLYSNRDEAAKYAYLNDRLSGLI